MTAKEYLLQYKVLSVRIENAERDIDEIREERNSISIVLDGMPRGSAISDKTAKLAVLLADMESELLELRTEAWLKKLEIIRTIDKLTDPSEVRLLHLRYLDNYTWEKIAVTMNYTYQWVAGTLHSNALQSVDKIINGGNNGQIRNKM